MVMCLSVAPAASEIWALAALQAASRRVMRRSGVAQRGKLATITRIARTSRCATPSDVLSASGWFPHGGVFDREVACGV